MQDMPLVEIYRRLDRIGIVYFIFAIIAAVNYFTPSTAAGWPILFMLILDILMALDLRALAYLGPGIGVMKHVLLQVGLLLTVGTMAFSIYRMASSVVTAFSIIFGLINIALGIPMIMIFRQIAVKESVGEGRHGTAGLAGPAAGASVETGSYQPPGKIPVAYATYA
jgi:hypothetical protein